MKEVEQIEIGKFGAKWGELPAAQTRAAPDSAFGQPEEPESPVAAALVGAGEAGSLAKWWGWAAGGDGCSSVVIGERVWTWPSKEGSRGGRKGPKLGSEWNGMCHCGNAHLTALTLKVTVAK